MQRSYEFCLGTTIAQDISQPSPYLYVHKTPEQAITNEIGYTSKDYFGKLSPKTVIKLMCWGPCVETPRKCAFSTMCVVENIGFQKKVEPTPMRATSKMRNTKMGSSRREVSPRNIKVARENSPARIYSSVVARKKSPMGYQYLQPFRGNGKVQEILQNMKEETDRLDREVKDIEKWNQFLDLEELDTINSSDNLD